MCQIDILKVTVEVGSREPAETAASMNGRQMRAVNAGGWQEAA
jgi:hypothetical protein